MPILWTRGVDHGRPPGHASSCPGGAETDTSGGDDINAHVLRWFLRVFDSRRGWGGLVIALLAGCGALALVAASILALRRVGVGYRVARSLAAAPSVTLGEAISLAAAAQGSYVRTTGRISSDEDFPDESQRPLVFRRQRIERLDPDRRWRIVEEERLAVPFGIEDRASFVAVDLDALGEGLVVIPRESTGTAAELPPDVLAALPEKLDRGTPLRVRVDQLSAVEHATVCGVLVTSPTGPIMTAGAGRPLVLSTLETPAAMRLLAAGHRAEVMAAALLLMGALGLVAITVVAVFAGW